MIDNTLRKDPMPEAEVSLRLAFYLLAFLGSGGACATPRDPVRIGPRQTTLSHGWESPPTHASHGHTECP